MLKKHLTFNFPPNKFCIIVASQNAGVAICKTPLSLRRNCVSNFCGNLSDFYKGLLKRQIASVATLLRNDEKAVIASGVKRSEAICLPKKQMLNKQQIALSVF